MTQLQIQQEENVTELIILLDEEILPKKNIVYESFVFFSTKQDEDMQYTQFLRILRVPTCEICKFYSF